MPTGDSTRCLNTNEDRLWTMNTDATDSRVAGIGNHADESGNRRSMASEQRGGRVAFWLRHKADIAEMSRPRTGVLLLRHRDAARHPDVGLGLTAGAVRVEHQGLAIARQTGALFSIGRIDCRVE